MVNFNNTVAAVKNIVVEQGGENSIKLQPLTWSSQKPVSKHVNDMGRRMTVNMKVPFPLNMILWCYKNNFHIIVKNCIFNQLLPSLFK